MRSVYAAPGWRSSVCGSRMGSGYVVAPGMRAAYAVWAGMCCVYAAPGWRSSVCGSRMGSGYVVASPYETVYAVCVCYEGRYAGYVCAVCMRLWGVCYRNRANPRQSASTRYQP